MKKNQRPKHFKRDTCYINVFDIAEMRVIAQFPYDVTDHLDGSCAFIRAKFFLETYAETHGFPCSNFSIIDTCDNTVLPFL